MPHEPTTEEALGLTGNQHDLGTRAGDSRRREAEEQSGGSMDVGEDFVLPRVHYSRWEKYREIFRDHGIHQIRSSYFVSGYD
jgi:hypothetical protein